MGWSRRHGRGFDGKLPGEGWSGCRGACRRAHVRVVCTGRKGFRPKARNTTGSSNSQEEIILNGPHQGRPVRTAGVPLEQASAAMVMVHGRGATADSILTLAPVLDVPGFAYLAPQARGNTWYPQSFLAPVESNEPGITSGLQAIGDVLARVTAAGIPAERTMLLGFSQGACLTLEFGARHTRRYGGIAGLSGGLIGPDGTPRHYAGSLEGTPVFLGCSDVDSHIPAQRVRETAEVLRGVGGEVTMRLYPGMGHLINEDEIDVVRRMMTDLVGSRVSLAGPA